jgi:hypothetical protein
MGSVTKIMLTDLAHTCSVADRLLLTPLSVGCIKAYAVEARSATAWTSACSSIRNASSPR